MGYRDHHGHWHGGRRHSRHHSDGYGHHSDMEGYRHSHRGGHARLRSEALGYAPLPQEHGNFFENLFGGFPQPQVEAAVPSRQSRHVRTMSPPAAMRGARGGTAVYDVDTATVYMPNGERLEAHSGLGEYRDNAGAAHVHMHGPTPHNVTYRLTPREQLFHGVPALRLNPVSGNVHGRAGLLAHTYMLGGGGDSNGCVSFRDYDKFLGAYQRGEVNQLRVVASRHSPSAGM